MRPAQAAWGTTHTWAKEGSWRTPYRIPRLILSFNLQGTDLVAAGFPCTDVSRAGLRKGLQGKVVLSEHDICGLLSQGAASLSMLVLRERLLRRAHALCSMSSGC